MTSPLAAAPEGPPIERWRTALRGCPATVLRETLVNLGAESLAKGGHPSALALAVRSALERTEALDEAITKAGPSARALLRLMGLRERPALGALGAFHAIKCLGIEPLGALSEALAYGLVVPRVTIWPKEWKAESPEWFGAELIGLPEAIERVGAIVVPTWAPPPAGPARQVRSGDGLEGVYRAAVAWQRVREAPLRRAQSGALYKRDRDRMDEDPALAGALADAIEPLPGMPALWLDLARGTGLILDEQGTDRTIAAPARTWSEHAVHLPQMLAVAWLNSERWHERLGPQGESSPVSLALPLTRPAILWGLAQLPPEDWAALEDVERALTKAAPDWDRLVAGPLPSSVLEPGARKSKAAEEAAEAPVRPASTPAQRLATLRAVLYGPAYQLGLVSSAIEERTDRPLARLTDFGRYVLGTGPPPPPRPLLDQFLMVQPNFEMIAYRQGTTAHALAELIKFARLTHVGGALEFKLTPQSIYLGLEEGLTPDQMVERLTRHAPRPPATGVVEAIKNWSVRRERVTYYAGATLLEFVSPADVETALVDWPTEGRPPRRIGPRLLLVEDANAVPFSRLRMTGARDYRGGREPCVEVEPDGLHLRLDLTRSDLMVDAEIARFAEDRGAEGFARRFAVTPASLARALADGTTPARLSRWFLDRTGKDLPPSLRLLLRSAAPEGAAPLPVKSMLVLALDDPALVDGLLQHPETRPCLGARLGPNALAVEEGGLGALRAALGRLGLALDETNLKGGPVPPNSPPV